MQLVTDTYQLALYPKRGKKLWHIKLGKVYNIIHQNLSPKIVIRCFITITNKPIPKTA